MTITETIARLKQHQATLGDGRDLRSDNEKAAWWAAKQEIAHVITTLQNAHDVDKPTRRLAELTAQRDAVIAKREEVEAEIAAAPDWRSFADGRQRDKEYERQQNLRMRLKRLADGTLNASPGVMFPPLDYLDAQIAEQRRKIDRAQAAIDAALKAAEAMLATTTTTTG
jgi:hypothetical protein